jgi:hypothetical protein
MRVFRVSGLRQGSKVRRLRIRSPGWELSRAFTPSALRARGRNESTNPVTQLHSGRAFTKSAAAQCATPLHRAVLTLAVRACQRRRSSTPSGFSGRMVASTEPRRSPHRGQHPLRGSGV